MQVEFQPSDKLVFDRPLTELQQRILTISNDGDERIVFKVKTTAPRQYSVRPNSDRIEPHQQIKIKVNLQPFKEEPDKDYKCKDKFQVVYAKSLSIDRELSLTDEWVAIERSRAEGQENDEAHQIREKKIRCDFAPLVNPETETNDIQAAPGEAEVPVSTPITSTTNVPTHTNTTMATETETAATTFLTETVSHPVQPLDPSPTHHDDSITDTQRLKAELKQAEETIAKLEKELALEKETHPDMLARSAAGRKLSPLVQPMDAVHRHLAQLERSRSTEGYPPQMLLIVAVLVFVFTYLFF